jgi:aminoglycoside phosphotransferase (APT) family kinase protein
MSGADIQRLGEGREAETLAWGNDRVLRLLKDPAQGERLDRERVALTCANRGGVPVPAVFGEQTLDGRPGLVMERIDGPDLLTLVGKRPWLVRRVARTLGETHARIHGVEVDEDLPTVHEYLRRCIADSEMIPDELRRPALEQLASLPKGNTLCHWDFHPANLLRGDSGPVVIDWTFALRGDPAADVARTRLTLRVGEAPSGSSVIAGHLDALGRRLMSCTYLSAYRKRRSVDLALVQRWEPLVALARLTAGIQAERERLISLFESASHDDD